MSFPGQNLTTGERLRVCCTCLKTNCDDLTQLTDLDNDCISYAHKIKKCIGADLMYNLSISKICHLCLKRLQIAYQFREMVILTQDTLTKWSKSIPEGKQSEATLIELKSELVTIEDGYVFLSTNDGGVKEEDESIPNGSEQATEQLELCPGAESETGCDKKKPDTKKRSLQCEHCSVKVSTPWGLQRHMKRNHLAKNKFECNFCNKSFKQKCHLADHMTSHTGEKNFLCTICHKRFPRMSTLQRHKKSHYAPPGHKTPRTPFLCTICGKSFPFSNGVQRHMRIHFGIRNYECQVCHRKFTQSTHLYVHMRTHTGEKPYICDTCGEAFSLNASLQKHMAIHKASTKESRQTSRYS